MQKRLSDKIRAEMIIFNSGLVDFKQKSLLTT